MRHQISSDPSRTPVAQRAFDFSFSEGELTDMGESQHTPGKLRVDVTIYKHMIAELRSEAEDRGIAQVWETRDEWPNGPRTPRGFTDANRLAACWNACQSFADPEATIAALQNALKYALNCFDRDSCDPMVTLDPVQAIALAKHAIAKAEGRQS